MAAGAGISQGAFQLSSSIASAEANKAQTQFEQQQLNFNSKLADLNADDAIRRGKKEAGKIQVQTRQKIGSQRAALAAQGLDPDVDSGALLQEDTQVFGALDELEVRNNARSFRI